MLFLEEPNYSISADIETVTEHDSETSFHIHVIHKYSSISVKKQESGSHTSTWNIVRSLEDFEENLRSVLLGHDPSTGSIDHLNDYSFEKNKSSPMVKNMVGSVFNTIKRPSTILHGRKSIGKKSDLYDIRQLENYLNIIVKLKPLPECVQSFLTENNDSTEDFSAQNDQADDEESLLEARKKELHRRRHMKPDEVSEIIISLVIAITIAVAKDTLSLIAQIYFLFFVPWSWMSLRQAFFSLLLRYFEYFQVGIKALIVFSCLGMYFHRFLGMIAGYFLRKNLGNNPQNNKFDIHIGWIGLRFGLDKNQIVVNNIRWKNPPRFTHRKFFLESEEIAITINVDSLIRLWHHKGDSYEGSYIQIDDILVDRFYVSLEKTDKKGDAINLWAAMGAEDGKQAKEMKLNANVQMKAASNMAYQATKEVAKGGVKVVKVGAEITKSAGSAGKQVVTGTASVVTKTAGKGITVVANTITDNGDKSQYQEVEFSPGVHRNTTDTVVLDGEDEEEEDDEEETEEPISPIPSTEFGKMDVTPQTKQNEKEKKPKKEKKKRVNDHYGCPYILEINRIILLDIRVRAQDFLSSTHSMLQNEIIIQIVSMFRRDLTNKGPPNSYRRGIYLDVLVWRVINHIMSQLFHTNKITMFAIVSTATLSQSTELLTSSVTNTIQGAAKGANLVFGTAVHGVSSVVSGGASMASKLFTK